MDKAQTERFSVRLTNTTPISDKHSSKLTNVPTSETL